MVSPTRVINYFISFFDIEIYLDQPSSIGRLITFFCLLPSRRVLFLILIGRYLVGRLITFMFISKSYTAFVGRVSFMLDVVV